MNASFRNLALYGIAAAICMCGQTAFAKTVKQPVQTIQFTVNAAIPIKVNNVKVALDTKKPNNGATVNLKYLQEKTVGNGGVDFLFKSSYRYLKVTLPSAFPGSKVSLLATSNVKKVADGNNFPLKTPSGKAVPNNFVLSGGPQGKGIYSGSSPVDLANYTKSGTVPDLKMSFVDVAQVRDPAIAARVRAKGASGVLPVTLSITPEVTM